MNHSLAKLKKALPGFNEIVFTEAMFWKILEREKIHFNFWNLVDGANGFYGVNVKHAPRVYRYIVIDEKLRNTTWLDTAFHELMHHFLHVPRRNIDVFFSKRHCDTRMEREADRYGLMMKFPKPLFLELSTAPADEPHGFSLKEIKLRKKIMKDYGE